MQIATIMKELTSALEHTSIKHLIALLEQLQRNHMELRKLNSEYEEHIADQDFEAEYLNNIEFDDKTIDTTSNLKYVIYCLRKKGKTGLTESSESQSHGVSAMMKLESKEPHQTLSLHAVPDRQDTNVRRDSRAHFNERD